MSQSNQILSPRMKVELARRWKEIEPSLLADLKSQPRAFGIMAQMMAHYRAIHEEAVIQCLSLGIRWVRIRKWSLDSPTLTDAERAAAIAIFKKSQARRPGWRSTKQGGFRYRTPEQRKPILPGDI